jgi:hypothetical protein|tara:strand:- start:579 stop:2045 length:1467 start_codon:yes stop_codon:yes gene_type:complete
MNNFKKLLAVCGNSVAAASGASPWGYTHSYQGLGLVNARITIYGDDLICFGGYNAGAASIKKDGSDVNWSKQYTGPTITHSTQGNETPSFGDIKSYNRPLVVTSTKTIFEQNGVWLWFSPFLYTQFTVYKFINTGTGALTSTKIVPQETAYNTTTSGIFVEVFGFCCDGSGNYMLSFESANQAYLQGYNSSDVLQWTKKTTSKSDGLIPLVENIGTDTEVVCREDGENRFVKVNITTGAVSNYNGKKLSGNNTSTSLANGGLERLGYDSSGNLSFVHREVDESDASTTPNKQHVWVRMSSAGSVVSSYGIAYLPSAQIDFKACMDSSDNLYLMHRDDGESGETTSEYGPKIIKIASDGTTVWERVITSDYAGTSNCSIHDINVSGDDDLFYVTCRLRHTSPGGYDTMILALPVDGTATTFTYGSKTYYFKALADGNSRFAVNSYSYTVSNDTGTATWSTATSPGDYTAGIGTSSDSDLTESFTELTVS